MKVEGFPTTRGSRCVDPTRAPTIEPPPATSNGITFHLWCTEALKDKRYVLIFLYLCKEVTPIHRRVCEESDKAVCILPSQEPNAYCVFPTCNDKNDKQKPRTYTVLRCSCCVILSLRLIAVQLNSWSEFI